MTEPADRLTTIAQWLQAPDDPLLYDPDGLAFADEGRHLEAHALCAYEHYVAEQWQSRRVIDPPVSRDGTAPDEWE